MSIFFFTNSLVSFKTANKLVKDVQQGTIDNMRNNLEGDVSKKNFDQMLKDTRKQSGKMHGNADFIRGVKHIDNQQEFFEALGVGASAKFHRSGQININNQLTIHPKAFMQINETQRAEILQHSADVSKGKISMADFNQKMNRIVQQNRIVFDNQIKTSYENISKALNTKPENLEVNGKKIFENLKPHEVNRLDSIMKGAGKNYDSKRVEVGIKFAKTANCKDLNEFCAAFEYVLRQLDEKVKICRGENPNPQRDQGIRVADFYFDKVCQEVSLTDLKIGFDQLQETCHQYNNANNPRFVNSMAAANHYDKHNVFPKIDPNNPLTEQQYFQVAQELTSQPITPQNSRITQSGDSLCITYTDPANGTMAIVYQNLADGTSVLATLMHKEVVISSTLIRNGS